MYGYGYKINSSLVVGAGGGGGGFTNTYSLDFDGVDDRIDTAAIDLGLENTISFWAKRNGTNFFGMVWGGTSQSNYYTVYLNNANNLLYRVGSGSNTFNNSDIISAIGGNDWFHCALVRNNSGADVLCYINGVLKQTKTSIVGSANNTIVKNIGSRGPTPLDFEITGFLDEMSLFNSALSASQISDIYNSGTPTDLSLLPTPPVAWYRMGDNASWKSPQWLIPNNSNKDKVSNYSFDFDGINDYVDCGNPTDLQITGAFTLSVWTKLDSSVGSQSCIMSKDSAAAGGQRAFSFWGKIVNKPVFYIWNGATNVNVSGTTNIADDTWHHVAVVYVPSTSIRIYVDGALEGTNTTSIPASINNAVYDFKIGVFANSLFPYKGRMDEVSVFNSDQSANISTLYNSGIPTTLPSGAVAHYKMGEEATFSTNWTVPDAVGSNDGTSNGMTIEDRVGDAPNSTSNSVSYNMDEVDRVEDTP